MDEIVEAVAKKLWLDAANFEGKEAFWDTMAAFDRASYHSAARAAIEATLQAVREPTPEMIVAGSAQAGCGRVYLDMAENIFTAMIDSALLQLRTT